MTTVSLGERAEISVSRREAQVFDANVMGEASSSA